MYLSAPSCLVKTYSRSRRQGRNARIAEFRRHDAAAGLLLTSLVIAGENLAGHPRAKLIGGAIDLLMRQCEAGGWRECIACGVAFDVGTMPTAALIAIPISADASAATASGAGICAACFRTRSAAEIDAAATRTLREILPAGRFLDPVRP